jgi:hypothetical protein
LDHGSASYIVGKLKIEAPFDENAVNSAVLALTVERVAYVLAFMKKSVRFIGTIGPK